MGGSPLIRIAIALAAVAVVTGGSAGGPAPAGAAPAPAGAAPAPAVVAGRVRLQQRTDYAGVVVQVGGQSAATGGDGRFSLADAPTGSQVARASAAGFLSAEGALTISPGQRLTLTEVTLLGGDVNGDGVIQLLDLVALGAAYGQCPPQDPRLDLNADRCLNILDLVILGANYGRAGPLPWAPLPEPTATPDPYPQPGATLTPEPYPAPDSTPSSARGH